MALQKTLTTPYDISGTVAKMEVDTFAVNTTDQLIHIGYTIMESDDTVIQTDRPHTLSGQEYLDFNTRVNELGATLNPIQSIITACLEALPGAGTIA